MAQLRSIVLLCASLACLLIGASASLSFVPAFVWSNTRSLESNGVSITYETLSSESLAETIISEFGFPDAQDEARSVDIVVAFVGNKLRSEDVSRGLSSGSDLLSVIQGAVTRSKSSMAIPYVTALKDMNTFPDVLLSTVLKNTESEPKVNEIVLAGSCAYNTPKAKTLGSLKQLKAYLSSRKVDGKTLLVVCDNILSESDPKVSISEGEAMEEVLKVLEESEAGYVASYVTDMARENLLALSRRRQLGSKLRVSNETFCDEVCQTKATILEGIFVAITLLIILISGICCMAGITTPSRFEQAKES